MEHVNRLHVSEKFILTMTLMNLSASLSTSVVKPEVIETQALGRSRKIQFHPSLWAMNCISVFESSHLKSMRFIPFLNHTLDAIYSLISKPFHYLIKKEKSEGRKAANAGKW